MPFRDTRASGSLNLMSGFLLALAVATLLLGVFTGLAMLASAARQTDSVGLADVAIVLWWFVGGAVCAAVLWTASFMVASRNRAAARQAQILTLLGKLASERSAEPSPALSSTSAATPAAADDEQMRLVLDQLVELNANMLLNEEQRRAKHVQRLAALTERLAGEIDRATEDGSFDRADAAVNELARNGADDATVELFRQRIEAARRRVEAEDLRQTTTRCEDLMAVAAFEQADATARELVSRRPRAAEAGELLTRVRREGTRFAEEHRRRMYGEIQKCASNRQWRKALAAAEKLIEKQPNSLEAKTVGAQLDTLRDNARLEETRELVSEIRELIGRNRFAEAVERSEEVIRRFPETAAAEELRGQIDRFRQRAREAKV